MKPLGRKAVLPLYMLLVAILIAACGGGGGGGILAGGGIGGTGITASGAITGFGSIFVTENEFEIVPGTTTISNDDNANASESDLSIGMVVTVRGTVNANGSVTATSIDFDADLEGPIADVPVVTSNDATEKSFTLLGTKVFVSANDTVFDDGPGSGVSFANISQGDLVEVSGFYDQNGDLHASFIERDDGVAFIPNVTEVELKGTVMITGANSFTLGNMTVNYDPNGIATDLSDLPGGAVADGMYVEVKGTLPAVASTTLAATRIEVEGLDVDEGDTEIQGIVTGYTDLAQIFYVAGQAVDASGGVQFEPATLSLVNGLEVEVEGDLAGGILVADEIKLRGGSIEIEAIVSSFDATARTIMLGPLGSNARILSVRTDNQTRLEGLTFTPQGTSLSIGDFLAIEAFDDGNGNLLATRVKWESSTGDFILQGPTDPAPATQDPVISILGVTFDTTSLGNNFEDESDASIGRGPFFARAEAGGELVKVKDDDPADGVPDEVEFEN